MKTVISQQKWTDMQMLHPLPQEGCIFAVYPT